MSTQIISGRGAAVDGVVCMSRVSARRTTQENAVWCSASDGAPIRVDANADWTANYNAYGPLPAFMPGDKFQFGFSTRDGKGYRSDAEGAVGGTVRIIWQQERSLPIRHEVTVEGNGPLTPGSYLYTDAGIPGRISSKERTLKVGSTFLCATEMELAIIHRAAVSAGDSCSSGWAVRDIGNFDAIVRATVHRSEFAGLPAFGTYPTVQLDAGNSLYWELTTMKLLSEGPDIELEGPEGRPSMVANELIFGFNGFLTGKGHIKKPGGATWWPS